MEIRRKLKRLGLNSCVASRNPLIGEAHRGKMASRLILIKPKVAVVTQLQIQIDT